MLYFIDMTCMFHPFNSVHMLKSFGILTGKVVSKSFPGRGGVGWGWRGSYWEQGGQVVTASDMRSGGPQFKSH